MKLDLHSIEIERFRSFRDRTSIDFAERGEGLHFLRGRNDDQPRLGANGAGKSTIWHALAWCLYGRTPDGLKGPDIKPWGGKGKTSVEVWFGNSARSWFITRTANPNTLLLDGDVVGQEKIDEVIGLSADEFFNTLLLAQGQPLFFDLAPREKMELFSTVLKLDRWEARSEAAATAVKECQWIINDVEAELKALDWQEDQLKELQLKTERLSDDWNKEREERLSKMEEDTEQLEKDVEASRERKVKADLDLENAATEYNWAIKATGKMVDRRHHLEHELIDAKRDSGKCPTCGQSVKLKRSGPKPAVVEKELTQTCKALDDYANICNDAQKKMKDAEQRLRVYQPQYAELNERFKTLNRLREEKIDERNPHKETIAALKRKQKDIVNKREVAEKDINIEQRLMERNKYWVQGFKDVKLHIIEDVLQELELATNAMLDEVGLIGWEVHYDIEKENKSGTIKPGLFVSILSPDNKEAVRWETWSGGEGQRLRIIGSLALSDVLLNNAGVETSFEILDEPTRGLSVEGVRDLCDYLGDRAKSLGRQIWFVDHHAVELASFTSSLTVVKDKEGSKIDTGSHREADRPKRQRVQRVA